jgi:hypothetical protein
MNIHRMMQESNRQDFAAFITRMLEAFKVNVQILERRLEEEQKFSAAAVREIDERLNRHERKIQHLEHITTIIIDEEQKRVEGKRQENQGPNGETDRDVHPTC